jgi:hypothetical protein
MELVTHKPPPAYIYIETALGTTTKKNVTMRYALVWNIIKQFTMFWKKCKEKEK